MIDIYYITDNKYLDTLNEMRESKISIYSNYSVYMFGEIKRPYGIDIDNINGEGVIIYDLENCYLYMWEFIKILTNTRNVIIFSNHSTATLGNDFAINNLRKIFAVCSIKTFVFNELKDSDKLSVTKSDLIDFIEVNHKLLCDYAELPYESDISECLVNNKNSLHSTFFIKRLLINALVQNKVDSMIVSILFGYSNKSGISRANKIFKDTDVLYHTQTQKDIAYKVYKNIQLLLN